MLGGDYKPRLRMNQLHNNILMQQIRAENKKYQPKHQPMFIHSHRNADKSGKKTYKQNLYQTTVLYLNQEGRSHSYSPSLSPSVKTNRQKRHFCWRQFENKNMQQLAQDRSKSKGKKKIHNFNQQSNLTFEFSVKKKNKTKKVQTVSPSKYGRRRMDNSPNFQNTMSSGFRIIG